MGSNLVNGELTNGTLYAEVKMTKSGSALIFVDPSGMAQLRKWGNKSFEHESVTYINDVKTTGGPVFSLAKLSNSSSALLMTKKFSKYLSEQIEKSGKKYLSGQIESSGKKYVSGQIESSEKFPFAAEVSKFQTIIKGVLVNKTNHISVFLTPGLQQEARSSWDETVKFIIINWTILDLKFHHTAGYSFHGLQKWKHRCSVIGD